MYLKFICVIFCVAVLFSKISRDQEPNNFNETGWMRLQTDTCRIEVHYFYQSDYVEWIKKFQFTNNLET